jgi:hypothetical protein
LNESILKYFLNSCRAMGNWVYVCGWTYSIYIFGSLKKNYLPSFLDDLLKKELY